MKIVTKDEAKEHYDVVIKDGIIGGTVGFSLGLAGVLGASRRYAAFRALTIPFRTFLVSSITTAGAVIVAERGSIRYARSRDPMYGYKDESQRELAAALQAETGSARALGWARQHRYTIVLSSWAASIGLALVMVGRNRYLTTSQKLVQARMYAQGLTLAVLLATATLEVSDAKNGTGHWETVRVIDPNDPEHKHMIEKRIHKEEYEGQDLWMDMVASEERRLAEIKKQKESAPENKVGAPASR
ncbi:mitochondrial hypoxia responsive domain containing protein [Grosmannia clavigera kw1407]|uniref:Mitochondrial hypoxia responsive domain containing protein n=1 Tax=Grosmannia clavigera (strain kw1407 / UAMH 11150) TaxID=655863 RepID=F0XAK6_GROCL|nr:mitochondrial hypoxia responsive domain containing protein [Grosmannia clavigera kw1407]EFX05463.1 mitochondrial hypoxia responsive domain containing protein [Grosmannia clavigera kw1407]